ncbi:uncharacterized protein LOC127843916 [Dreissena polymorpha]|uniref:uncharacterized protein LOC127843916 n=1 Tax=Dreissena polymorpha TaxID=45954 RepID=UPI002264DB62|nr:uncharacterized protein LOC127843916 [Dreissena polymorpha]
MSYHNYDEILTENMDPMPRFPERQYSSDDITKGRIQISGILRKNQPSTILKTSKLQVPDHAEERKFKSTLPKPKPSGELNIDHKHSKCAVDVHRDVADCDSLDNGLVEALNNDRFIHVGSNSIYYCNATLNTSPSVGNSIRKKDLRSRWQKPDLNPQKDAHHTCPAEKKIKKHVFLACLILLLGAMCMLVVAIIDGWMMHNSGRGVNGKDTFLGNRRKFDTLLNSTFLLDNYNDTGPGNFTGNVFDNTND